MKIVSCYSEDFKHMADNLAKSKYEVILNKLDDLPDNKRFIKQCHYKLDFVRQALDECSEDVAWVDADCLIVKDLGDPLGDCDVAVTLRRPAPKDAYFKYSGLLNAGVIFFKNNQRAREFINRWEYELPNGEHKTDQEALNLSCQIDTNTKVNDTIKIDDIKIKILSCDEYNFIYMPEENDARIIHFKGDTRIHYDTYLKTYAVLRHNK